MVEADLMKPGAIWPGLTRRRQLRLIQVRLGLFSSIQVLDAKVVAKVVRPDC